MFIDKRLGGVPRYFFDRPKDWGMRVPETIRKSIVFFGRKVKSGDEERPRFFGTGFFVGVPSQKRTGVVFLYIVTAKHIARSLDKGDWFMRVNRMGGGMLDVKGTPEHKIFFHPTEPERVDVAVIGFEHSLWEQIDADHIPESMFLDDRNMEEYSIGAGDEVFMSGMFGYLPGREQMLPIVRTGTVALIPSAGELVPVNIDEKIVQSEVYLIEARSIGGLSGSPVFVRSTIGMSVGTRKDGDLSTYRRQLAQVPGDYFLFGLVHGHWDVFPDEKNDVQPSSPLPNSPTAVNMGIAKVIPAKKIREALYNPELNNQRDEQDQKAFNENPCTID
jgi:hypothetical protein